MVDTKQYSYNKLRGRIVELFGTQANFANALETSTQVVSEKLNCKKGFSQKDIEKWSKLLEIEVLEYGLYFFN